MADPIVQQRRRILSDAGKIKLLKHSAAALFLLAAPLYCQQSTLEVNPVLFTVMTAINAAGYDADLSSNANSAARAKIRAWVAEQNPGVLAQLQEFYTAHRKGNPARDLSQYISFALCLESADSAGGPEFRYRMKVADLPPDVQELDGLEKLLTLFYRQTKLSEFLKANDAALNQPVANYYTPVTLALQQIDGYMRNPNHSATKGNFHVFLDVMAAPNQIHMRSYANDLFMVITTSPEPQLDYIKNAYLHFLIDPIAMRFITEIDTKKSLIDFAQGAPALDEQYKKDFALLTVASLVKAMDARMAPVGQRTSLIDQALREGFILAPYFAESLPEYEVQEQSMRYYLPMLIKGIDLRKETARLDGVTFDKTPRERRAKLAPAPVIERSPAEKTLEDAEEIYGKKDYKQASELFRRALTETNSKPLKARSYYGLARISALTKDPEAAVQLFEKTLAEGAEPQVAAWSHVFLGRLLDLAQETDNARGHFDAALATKGASPASRKAAEDGLKGLKPAKTEP